MVIVDAHLDLAYNAVRGRPVTLPASQQPPDSEGTPTVGLPDLASAGVALVCGTIFCEPATAAATGGYRTAHEAHVLAQRQLQWYQHMHKAGEISLVTCRGDPQSKIEHPKSTNPPGCRQSKLEDPESKIRTIMLMEGADALRDISDVHAWFSAGLRIVGLAWRRTRYAGGTGEPGPLTAEGRDLVAALDSLRIIHDLSHLAEQSFWELLNMSGGPVMASHSNCRAIIPTDRQLSDAMIRAVRDRGGVIGVNFYDRFLIPPGEYGQRRATLADVVGQFRHLCDVIGDDRHVGLGTDMDGGFGRERLPLEITTSADLPRVADILSAGGFGDDAVARIMGGNWLEFFARNLPA